MSTYRSPILEHFPIRAGGDILPVAGGAPPPTGADLYMRFAFAGAVCCSVTHGGLTPVDVVKTRIQLEPEVYNRVSMPF
jgi:solute carrier family 25 (mitochondrial phosphate transporter), member 3